MSASKNTPSNKAKFTPSGKGKLIAATLRSRIIDGDFQPKARIPRREDLINEFAASSVTVQNALSTLQDDGFVVSKGKLGTFVVDRPPHLNQFALVFSMKRNSYNWGLFWEHIAEAAQHVITDQGLKLKIYTGIDTAHPGADYEKLLHDVRHERLAGIIFTSPPFLVRGTEILDKPGIPRVILAKNENLYGTAGYVDFNFNSFRKKAVSFLKRKQCKVAAILQTPNMNNTTLLEMVEQAGIQCPYHLRQAVPLTKTDWAKNCMRLMFDHDYPGRPDTLLILDDNLFEPAVAGILDAGMRIPQDLNILTNSNFPWENSSPLPVTRLGFDMHSLLKLFLAELENQRNGHAPRENQLDAVFEDEIISLDEKNSKKGARR